MLMMTRNALVLSKMDDTSSAARVRIRCVLSARSGDSRLECGSLLRLVLATF
jgi:hypothetical protein